MESRFALVSSSGLETEPAVHLATCREEASTLERNVAWKARCCGVLGLALALALLTRTFCSSLAKAKTSALESAWEEASSVLPYVKVVPYGVLGEGLVDGEIVAKSSSPGKGVAVVDPAGLQFIHTSPGGACCASGAIYHWLGISDDKSFPHDVVSAMQDYGDAAFHRYGNKDVIHVAGPNFAFASDTEEVAVQKLARAYGSVLSEFVESRAAKLRLLPISSGTFAGGFRAKIPRMTFTALELGFRSMSSQAKQALLKLLLEHKAEMCIFEEENFEDFQRACSTCNKLQEPHVT